MVTESSWISSSDGEQVVSNKERNNRSVKIAGDITVRLKDHRGAIVTTFLRTLLTCAAIVWFSLSKEKSNVQIAVSHNELL